MRALLRPVLLAPALAAAAACSSSTARSAPDASRPGADAGDGGSTTPGAAADAFVQATLGAGAQSPAPACPLPAGAPALTLGSEGAVKPDTVTDGAAVGADTASVACTVHAVGAGYDVSLKAALAGPTPASLTITTPAGQGAVTTSGASGVTATFVLAGATYASSSCTLAFTYQGFPVMVSPAIAPGRIWAHVSCPEAAGAAEAGAARCDGEADFLFEQCGQ